MTEERDDLWVAEQGCSAETQGLIDMIRELRWTVKTRDTRIGLLEVRIQELLEYNNRQVEARRRVEQQLQELSRRTGVHLNER